MLEVTAFLADQTLAARAGLYAGLLLFLLSAGGLSLALVVRGLDRIGELVTSNADWQTLGGVSKQEMLLLISVLLYAELLLSVEPPLRAFASVCGNALLASLVLAPIVGAMVGFSSLSFSRRT